MCGENRLARSLDFHVNMARSTRVFSGDNGFKGVASLGIGELVTTQPETSVVVIPVAICMPEVQPGMSNRLACGRKHVAGDRQRRSREARFS